MKWIKANPELTKTIVKVTVALAGLAAAALIIGTLGVAFGGLATAVGFVLTPVGAVVTAIAFLYAGLEFTTGWVRELSGALTGGAVALGTYTVVTNGSYIAMYALSTALKVARVAQIAFNASMAANPIGLVITAIGALVGWVITARDEFGGWTEAIIHVGKTMVDFLVTPMRGILWLVDKISGTDLVGSFDKQLTKLQKVGAEFAGVGNEFDRVSLRAL